jgi:hypothetical protein
MYAGLIGNLVWHRLAPLPLLVHVLIAAAAIHLSFTIWHEAIHRNVSNRSWLNHAVGISTSSWTISIHNWLLDRGWPEPVARFFHYQNPLLHPVFVLFDTLRARLGMETSNQRMIARKPGLAGTAPA